MAKRFTDTNKWDKAWFRKLSPRLKCAWDYLTTKCDHAGVWSIDVDALEFHVGEPVSLAELLAAFDDRVEVRGDHLVLTGFVAFQYGELNPANRVHRSVIERLERLSSPSPFLDEKKPLGSPLEGAKDKDKDKDKDKEQDKGGVGGFQIHPPIARPPAPSAEDVAQIREAWLDTLARFKAGRKNLLPEEELLIARSIQRWGKTACLMAIIGKRHEPKGAQQGGYDPGSNLSLRRVLNHQEPDKFERLMNIGVKAHNERGTA